MELRMTLEVWSHERWARARNFSSKSAILRLPSVSEINEEI